MHPEAFDYANRVIDVKSQSHIKTPRSIQRHCEYQCSCRFIGLHSSRICIYYASYSTWKRI
ncbi:unnamed protein product, partial [Vitis vinifera]